VRIHPHDLLLQELPYLCPETRHKCLEHLAGCPECRDKLTAWKHSSSSSLAATILPFVSGTGPSQADPFREVLSHSAGAIEDLYLRERAGAPALFAELVQYSIEQRTLIVRNSQRFHTWGFCELLLARSREQNFQDPSAGEGLALLAVEVLDHIGPELYGSESLEDLRARAWSYVGNSRRIQADLQGAEEAFTFSFSFLRLGTGEPMEKAMLLDLYASLLTKQRRFAKASSHLSRAVTLFMELGETHRAGRALIKLATIHSHNGQPETAIFLRYRALRLIDPTREPRLVLVACQNLIDDLIETGQFMAAQKMLIRAKPLYKHFAPWLSKTRRWIEGKIALGFGQLDRAEALFLEIRGEHLAEGTTGAAYEIAFVSLELASLYAEQGRMAELKRLAEEMVPIFSSCQIHREALAALDYWRQAVEAERACTTLIAGIAAFLKRVRNNPELRFQVPD
jgi:tetratricopeptide (TPR) repeat protein